MKIKSYSIVASLALTVSLLAGCSSNSNGNEANSASGSPAADGSNAPAQTDKPADTANPYYATDGKVVNLTWLMRDDEQQHLNTKGKFFEDVKNITGVNINAQPVIPDELTNQVNLALTSKNMPDIIEGDTKQINELLSYGEQGAFLDLRDLIKQNAPHIEKLLEDPRNEEAFKWGTSTNGKLYALPSLSYNASYSKMFDIRSDLLKKYNLPMPQTVDDYENYLYAIYDGEKQAMDKLGRPFYSFASVTPDFEYFFPMFETANDFVEKDGKVDFGPVTDNFKTALMFLNKLYAKQMIPPESFSMSEDQYYELMYNGSLGSSLNSVSRLAAANSAFEKVNAKDKTAYQMELMTPLQTKDGNRYNNIEATYKQPIVISAATKDPVAAIKLLDWLYSDEGNLLSHYGISEQEGIGTDAYTYFNDEAKVKEQFPAWYASNLDLYKGTQYEADGKFTGKFVQVAGDPAQSMQKLLDYGYFNAQSPASSDMMNTLLITGDAPVKMDATQSAVQLLNSQFNSTIDLNKSSLGTRPYRFSKLTDQEFSDISTSYSSIRSKADEYIAKFVTGQISFDKWDQYKSDLESLGLSKLVETYNAGFARYMGK